MRPSRTMALVNIVVRIYFTNLCAYSESLRRKLYSPGVEGAMGQGMRISRRDGHTDGATAQVLRHPRVGSSYPRHGPPKIRATAATP